MSRRQILDPSSLPDDDAAALTRVLRAQMTAVNQQFTHIVALRTWGDYALAERITEVDKADFATAIRILDFLASRGAVPSPGSDSFAPGATVAEILLAEHAVEERLVSAIAAANCHGAEARGLVAGAAAPRAAYASWMCGQSRHEMCQRRPSEPLGAIDVLFSAIVTWIEQAMIHAFLQWHRSDRAMADAAWASSGAAMVRGAGLTRALAALGTTPVPGRIAAPRASTNWCEAQELDRAVAARCAQLAEAAADSVDDARLRAECRRAAEVATVIAEWRPDAAHPALATNPPGLTTLEDPLREHVWSRQSRGGQTDSADNPEE